MAAFPLSTLLEQLDLPRDHDSMRGLAVGLACQCLERQYSSSDLRTMLGRLLPSILANQYEFYVDTVGRVVGFITWIVADSGANNPLSEHSSDASTSSQQPAGKDLWVVDFAVFDGQLVEVLQALRDTRFKEFHTVTYSRQKKRVRLIKQISRNDRNSFFAKKSQLQAAPQGLTKRFDILHAHTASLKTSLDLGNALLAARTSARHLDSLVPRVMHMFREALAIRQCSTYFDDTGEPLAIVAWAWLSDATISRMRTTAIQETHTSEWNEGEQLCFFDIAITDPCKARFIADSLRQMFPEESTVLLYTPPRKDESGSFTKVDRYGQRGAIENWLGLQLEHNAVFQQRK